MFELDEQQQLPLLHVFGGKITTFRKLAEHALQKLKPFFRTWVPTGRAQQCCPAEK